MNFRVKKFRLVILLIFTVFVLSACSDGNGGWSLGDFLNSFTSMLSNFWGNIKQVLDNWLASIGDMFSGLSGIGEALRNMLSNIKLFR